MSNLINHQLFTAIKNLQLAAKTTVDGFMSGIHKNNVKGMGLEFSQYRSYEPGDDLRWIDWKMFARSDRYYIRESEIETSISIRFLIDASNSMLHEDNGITKIDYAKYVAACLGYLATQQGDAIGLHIFNEGEIFSLPAKHDAQHLSRFFHQLENINVGRKFSEPVHYKNIFSEIRKREMLVFITDLYESNNEIMHLLTNLSAGKHEIIVLHIMGKNELEFDFGSYDMLEDLESGNTVAVSNALKKDYQLKLENYLQATKTKLLDKQIHYYLLNMSESLNDALRNFLVYRNKLNR